MFVVRPVRPGDLSDLLTLARLTAEGLTTLPRDEASLSRKIRESRSAFEGRPRRARAATYLFVLEEMNRRSVVGTAGIVSKVGRPAPYYSYKIKTETHVSSAFRLKRTLRVLHRMVRHDGPTEIGSLFIHPDSRHQGLGRLLSLTRFLYMGTFPNRFEKTVISELRGVVDERGQPPFWEHVGRFFFETDFYTADFLSGTGHKEFIAQLLPRHPIYIPLLPRAAQEAIGAVHRDARAALALLEQEGFRFNGEVDIFDAGPTVIAPFRRIRTVRASTRAKVRSMVTHLDGPECLIGNGKAAFRSSIGRIALHRDGTVSITKEIAEALQLKAGDHPTYVALRPER